MEVTTVRDHITHAIVGGQEAESMGISDDPAFYHMLSSTLYSDEKRAVVRETLCNGWDAHIEAGCTDKPLKVTLRDGKLSIQDFGLGIRKDLIKPIYGVYGASTKKKDKNQTGGFGLGCKAPFSYVEHFEVVSCHAGEKTIYRMSKSSGAVLGRPSIQPIVTVPTTESGITVSMAIKPNDMMTFRALIIEIVRQGEMLVEFNDEMLTTIPFSQAKHGWMLVPKADFGARHESSAIQVRYGSVVYPVEKNEAYSSHYDKAREYMQKISSEQRYYHSTNDWVLVMMAQPDTISITPSREQLNMSEHTISTLKELLANFVNTAIKETGQLKQVCYKMDADSVTDIFRFQKPVDAMSTSQGLLSKRLAESNKAKYITEASDAAAHLLLYNYPSWKGFHERSIKLRLQALIESGFGHRALLRSFRRQLFQKNPPKDRRGNPKHNWFARKVIWPIIREMRDEPLLSVRNFGIWDDYRFDTSRSGYSSRSSDFIQPQHYKRQDLDELLPFCRGVVALGHSRAALDVRLHRMPAIKHWFGERRKILAYLVPRNPKKVEAALSFFQRMGYYVVDTTARQKWDAAEELERAEEKAAQPPKPKKKKLEGYAMLSNLTTELLVGQLYAEDGNRIEKPEFIVRIHPSAEHVKGFDNCYFTDKVAMRRILRRFGDRGGVVAMTPQLDKAIEEGAADIVPWVADRLLEAYQTIPEIEEFYRNQVEHSHKSEHRLDGNQENIFEAILGDEVLRQKWGLCTKPTQIVRDYVGLFGEYDNRSSLSSYPSAQAIKDLIKTWEPNAKVTALAKAIQNSELIDYLSLDRFIVSLKHLPEDRKKVARSLIMTVLKG
jgi:hypothetical protein